MKLIGIHGKANSGKDEFRHILCSTYGFEKASFATKIKQIGIEMFNLSVEDTIKKTKESRVILQGIGISGRLYDHVCRDIKEKTKRTGTHSFPEGPSGFPLWVENIVIEEFNVSIPELKSKKKYVKKVLRGVYNMFIKYHKEFLELTKETSTEDIWIKYLDKEYHDKEGVFVVPDVRFPNEKDFISIYGESIKIVRVDGPGAEKRKTHVTETSLDINQRWYYTVLNEHKAEWKGRLIKSAANLVRKLQNDNFFTDEDIEKFKINLNEHE